MWLYNDSTITSDLLIDVTYFWIYSLSIVIDVMILQESIEIERARYKRTTSDTDVYWTAHLELPHIPQTSATPTRIFERMLLKYFLASGTLLASAVPCQASLWFIYDLPSFFFSLACSHSSQSMEEAGFNDPSLLENLQSNHVSTVEASRLLSSAQWAKVWDRNSHQIGASS